MELGLKADWAMVVVTGISAGLILYQLRADHQRTKIELSVTLLNHWTNGLKDECSAIVDLVSRLSFQQCDAVAKREPLYLDDNPSNREAVRLCLYSKYSQNQTKPFEIDTIISGGKIKVEGEYVMFIRSNTIYYLNLIESMLVAWYLGAAYRSILEDQFRFLKDDNLEQFREAAKANNSGNDRFPSISKFIIRISAPNPRPLGPVQVLW